MYRRHTIIAFLIFFCVMFFAHALKLTVTKDFIGHLIGCFSIISGSHLTGLSILFGTNYSKRLRQEEDPIKSTQTKLHTLRAYFNYSFLASLSSIVLLLLISLFGIASDSQPKIIIECSFLLKVSIRWDNLLIAATLGLVAINIMFMYLLFKVFINGFIEEGVSHE